MRSLELSEQKKLARCLNRSDILWTATANGGLRVGATGGQMKASGVQDGVPDVLVFTPIGEYLGAAIEMKSPKEKRPAKGRRWASCVSSEQKEWLRRLELAGWAVNVCYSREEAVSWLRSLGYPVRWA